MGTTVRTSKENIVTRYTMSPRPLPAQLPCYLLGLSRMKLATFLLVSIIGRIPGTYLLTVQGAKFRNQEYYEVVIFAVASAVILLVAYLYRNKIYRWIKRKHTD